MIYFISLIFSFIFFPPLACSLTTDSPLLLFFELRKQSRLISVPHSRFPSSLYLVLSVSAVLFVYIVLCSYTLSLSLSLFSLCQSINPSTGAMYILLLEILSLRRWNG
ncbi:hypothetical protein B0H34DRAFT_714464 [Crassisporium funariophilum]|nr:hypothetical protein B0H34DRAFT_714464 [Crassisporium funariophilum]